MRGSVWRHFVGLVFRPFKGVWNAAGVGIPGAAAFLLWGFDHPEPASLLILVSVFALTLWAGYRLQRDLDLARVPSVVFDEQVYGRKPSHTVASVQQVLDAVGTLSPERQVIRSAPEIGLTRVRNDPPLRRREADVDDAEVVLRFYSLPGWDLEVECDGRWFENDPPKAGKSLDPIRRRRLPANGQSHEIELLVKHSGKGGAYAGSVELYLSPGLRSQRLLLAGDSYAFTATVRGLNLADDVTKWFTLTNLPDGRIEFGVAPPSLDTSAVTFP